jgi:hypothetical protein
MRRNLYRLVGLFCSAACLVAPFTAYAQTTPEGTGTPAQIERQRLDELKAMKREMMRMMRDYEARIARLEAEMKEQQSAPARIVVQSPAPAPVAVNPR